MPAVERMTAEEYPARPYDPRERGRELIGGEIVDMHDRRLPHELACKELMYALELWTRAQPGRGLGIRSIDVLVSDGDVHGPDILWYRDDRVPPAGSGWPYAVPDLAGAVLVFRRSNPDASRFDVALELTRDEALTSRLLPGFALPLDAVLAGQ